MFGDAQTKCYGVKSPLKPWIPHPLCRTCARYTWLGPADMAPAMERVGGYFECRNRINESTPGEANQSLVVEGLTAVDTPGTQSEARDGCNRARASITEAKECYR